jgi:hypothetical protein
VVGPALILLALAVAAARRRRHQQQGRWARRAAFVTVHVLRHRNDRHRSWRVVCSSVAVQWVWCASILRTPGVAH